MQEREREFTQVLETAIATLSTGSDNAENTVPVVVWYDPSCSADSFRVWQVSLLKGQLDKMKDRSLSERVVMAWTAFGQGLLIAGKDGVHLHRLRPRHLAAESEPWQDIISPKRKVAFKGFLCKATQTPLVWNKRFFHLRDNVLSCYLDEDAKELRRVLPLQCCTVSWHESGTIRITAPKGQKGFELKGSSKTVSSDRS